MVKYKQQYVFSDVIERMDVLRRQMRDTWDKIHDCDIRDITQKDVDKLVNEYKKYEHLEFTFGDLWVPLTI